MNMSEDKLQLLRFVCQLLSPRCPPKVWPRMVKADLGTHKLVHREKGREGFGEDVTEGFPKSTEGLGDLAGD